MGSNGEENPNDLQLSLAQYEAQINQINLTLISLPPDDPERGNLISLKNDVQELIQLTKEHLTGLEQQNQETVETFSNKQEEKEEDPFDREYALFKAEIEKDMSNEKNKNDQSCSYDDVDEEENVATLDIQNELATLQGSKCQAPYLHNKWEEDCKASYHNALVLDVANLDTPPKDIQQIMVRVMYVNPVHRKMLPCPYYLEGECKFPDDKCHYSHGNLVTLGDLKEYKEPDFSSIKVGSSVLAKQKDNLWHHATVTATLNDEKCQVKFKSSYSGTADINLHELLPLDDNSERLVDNDSDEFDGGKSGGSNSNENCLSDNEYAVNREEIIQLSLLRAPGSFALGDWEKHTKGIGSRLMASMGYIPGSGLGVKGDGRLQPVEALVYPPGKSLDHCMALREAAGGDPDMFKAEKRRLKQQMKEDKRREREYEKEKQKVDVFSFINNKLSSTTGTTESSSGLEINTNLASSSRKGLNVERFRISEDIKRVEKDVLKLKESLTRHQPGSQMYKLMSNKLLMVENELNKLHATESSIAKEQNKRDSHKKLSVF